MEFRSGDVIRMKEDCSRVIKGKEYTLIYHNRNKDLHTNTEHTYGCTCPDKWELIKRGEPMDRYAALKIRIDSLDEDTSMKEFRDLLLVVGEEGYYLNMPTFRVDIFEIQNTRREKLNYSALTTAPDFFLRLRQQLLWLLDHSGIKKPVDQFKIKEIESKIELLKQEVETLKKG